MALFATCLLCGKKKLSLSIGKDGLCSACHTVMESLPKEETAHSEEAKEKFYVSSFMQQAASDYTPLSAASQKEPVYVFIDVETTGLNPTKDAIVQVSALRFFGKKAIDGLNSYVNPCRPIPKEATKIHGITDDKIKDSPTIDEIKEPFMNLIKGAILVGYNAIFDLNFLDHAFHGALANVEFIDVMWIAKTLLTLPDYRLETVADYAEFHPEGGYHNSLTDCTATAAIFFRLAFDNSGFVKTYHFKASEEKQHSSTYKDIPTVSNSTNHPLYGKKIVFAGKLSISRKEATQMATAAGAIIRSEVSGKTDYLVLGEGVTSNQEEKIDDLLLEGNTRLQVICEREFMNLLQGKDRFSVNVSDSTYNP